jgi:Recombinase
VGSIGKPSRSVLERRRAVCATFALTVRELTAAGFASRYSIADELNRRKVPTLRGGRWHYTSVVRMLTRLGMDKPAYGEPGAGAANRWAALVRAQTLAPIIRQLQSSGIFALRAIARELNARAIPTAHGGKWHPSSVDRLLRRLARVAERPKPSKNIFQAPRLPRRTQARSRASRRNQRLGRF